MTNFTTNLRPLCEDSLAEIVFQGGLVAWRRGQSHAEMLWQKVGSKRVTIQLANYLGWWNKLHLSKWQFHHFQAARLCSSAICWCHMFVIFWEFVFENFTGKFKQSSLWWFRTSQIAVLLFGGLGPQKTCVPTFLRPFDPHFETISASTVASSTRDPLEPHLENRQVTKLLLAPALP